MPYINYFNELNSLYPGKSVELRTIMLKALATYSNNSSNSPNRLRRAVDTKLIRILLESRLSDANLMQAVEAFFIGALSSSQSVDTFLSSIIASDLLSEHALNLRSLCVKAGCKHQRDEHVFEKGLTDNSQLEEAIIAAIHVYQARHAKERYDRLGETELHHLRQFVLELTNADMCNVTGCEELDESKLERVARDIGDKEKFERALSRLPDGYKRRFDEILEDLRLGRMPFTGKLEQFVISYDDASIVRKILFNLIIRQKISSKDTLWQWYDREYKNKTILSEFRTFVLYACHDLAKDVGSMLDAYDSARTRRMHLRKLGRVQKPSDIIVALHGWLDCGDTWYPLAKQAEARGMMVIAYDQFGFGRDDDRKHNRMDVGKMLVDLESVIDRVKSQYPDTPLHLVGHSMGGAIISVLARYSQRCDVIASFHALTPAIAQSYRDFVKIQKTRRKIDYQEVLLRMGRSPGIVNIPKGGSTFITTLSGYFYSIAELMVTAVSTFPTLSDLMLSTYKTLGQLMDEQGTPVYIYVGEQDLCVNPEEFKSLRRDHPRYRANGVSFRLFHNAYHMPSQSRNGDYFNAQILDDVQENPSPHV